MGAAGGAQVLTSRRDDGTHRVSYHSAPMRRGPITFPAALVIAATAVLGGIPADLPDRLPHGG